MDAPKGTFVLAPGGMTHDFKNRSSSRAGVLNFSIPGDFEKNMPSIATYFAARQWQNGIIRAELAVFKRQLHKTTGVSPRLD